MKFSKIEEIKKMINDNKIVKVIDIENKLNIPRTTLLRYLNNLENEGFLVKSFGEVKLRTSSLESFAMQRLKEDVDYKRKIADKAIKKINDGDVIFIDGGSTTYYIAEKLKDRNVSIFTNSLILMPLINSSYVPSITIVPGRINKKTLVSASSSSIMFIKDLIFDKSFIGFNSFVDNWYSTTNEDEAILKQVVIQQTKPKNSYVVGNKNKSEQKAGYSFANKSNVELIDGQKEVK